MKIAHVSLLYDEVAPCPSSNAARAMLYLIEELVGEGHEVTLFAAEPWRTSAACVYLQRVEPCESAARRRLRVMNAATREAGRFDVIHFHCDQLNFSLTGSAEAPSLATLHAPCALTGRYSTSDVVLVATSARQLPSEGSWRTPIHQGLPDDLERFREAPGGYVVFAGKVEPESGIESAVIAAARCQLPLKVIGDVVPSDRTYFLETFKPLLKSSARVQWISDPDERGRSALIGGAAALIASYDRCGASALNIAEAFACGTPVVAWSDTTAADLVQNGVTGWIIETVEQAADALARVPDLDRQACRRAFEEQFDVRRIAGQYLGMYRGLIRSHRSAAVTVGSVLHGRRQRPA